MSFQDSFKILFDVTLHPKLRLRVYFPNDAEEYQVFIDIRRVNEGISTKYGLFLMEDEAAYLRNFDFDLTEHEKEFQFERIIKIIPTQDKRNKTILKTKRKNHL